MWAKDAWVRNRGLQRVEEILGLEVIVEGDECSIQNISNSNI